MTSNQSYDRESFLADIIAELSRQESEDHASFQGSIQLSDADVFRKLCFDYPLVGDNDLSELHQALDNMIRNNKPGVLNYFRLNSTFVTNIIEICNRDEPASTGKNKLAAWLFLALPSEILATDSLNNLAELLVIEKKERSSDYWRELLVQFQQFVSLGSVSILLGAPIQLLQKPKYMPSLCRAVTILGVFVTDAEAILQKYEEVANLNGERPANANQQHRQREAFAYLDICSGLDLAVNSVQDFLLFLLQIPAPCSSSSSSSSSSFNPAPADTAAAPTAAQLACVAAVLDIVKQCWLHLSFLYRDVLQQHPQLLSTHGDPFWCALRDPHHHATEYAPGGSAVALSTTAQVMHRDAFPNSSEVLYLLSISTLAGGLLVVPVDAVAKDSSGSNRDGTPAAAASSSSSSGARSVSATAATSATGYERNKALATGKDALKRYFDKGDNLSHFVQLCSRMKCSQPPPRSEERHGTTSRHLNSSSSTAGGGSSSTSSSNGGGGGVTHSLKDVIAEAEVMSFMVDVAMLYVYDPTTTSSLGINSGQQPQQGMPAVVMPGSARAAAIRQTLIGSRLLPSLLLSLQGVLRLHCQQAASQQRRLQQRLMLMDADDAEVALAAVAADAAGRNGTRSGNDGDATEARTMKPTAAVITFCSRLLKLVGLVAYLSRDIVDYMLSFPDLVTQDITAVTDVWLQQQHLRRLFQQQAREQEEDEGGGGGGGGGGALAPKDPSLSTAVLVPVAGSCENSPEPSGAAAEAVAGVVPVQVPVVGAEGSSSSGGASTGSISVVEDASETSSSHCSAAERDANIDAHLNRGDAGNLISQADMMGFIVSLCLNASNHLTGNTAGGASTSSGSLESLERCCSAVVGGVQRDIAAAMQELPSVARCLVDSLVLAEEEEEEEEEHGRTPPAAGTNDASHDNSDDDDDNDDSKGESKAQATETSPTQRPATTSSTGASHRTATTNTNNSSNSTNTNTTTNTTKSNSSKTQSHRAQEIVSALRAATAALAIIAPAAKTAMMLSQQTNSSSSSSSSSLSSSAQMLQVLNNFVDELLPVVNKQIQNTYQLLDDKNSIEKDPSGSRDIDTTSIPFLKPLEIFKKQLKRVQELLRDGSSCASSKAD